MAYLIRLASSPAVSPLTVRDALTAALARDGRFRSTGIETYQTPWNRAVVDAVDLGKLRLTSPKPYCGQHPGECLVGGPRKRSTHLEWEDWIALNGLVNDVLDSLEVSADVTTKPAEAIDKMPGMKGLFWLRRGLERRHRYEWRTAPGQFGRSIRWWNPGTPDQFAA